MAPRRNVELKLRDADPEATLRAALAAGAEDRGVLVQRDTYFGAPSGRLKLRETEGEAAELIAYERSDRAQARTSEYRRVPVADPAAMQAALAAALGVTGVVAKRRHLLQWRGVRIHLDDVDGLGRWVEIEAPAGEESDLSAEHALVEELLGLLGPGGTARAAVTGQGYAELVSAADAAAATELLVGAARRAMERAWAPYSGFAVGAAVRDEHGVVHAGANVENAAPPQGQCAEASAVGALVSAGSRAIREVAVMADSDLVTPCGGCRQRLAELGHSTVPVHLCGPEGIRRTVTLGELLPLAFDLPEGALG